MKKYLFKVLVILLMIGAVLSIEHIVNAHKFISFSSNSGNIPPQSFTPNENQVCFYENDNYSGEHICLNSNGEYADLGNYFVGNTSKNWHDKISSVIIGAKACAIMYEHPNGGGYCLILKEMGQAQGIFQN
jgi:hypothetical protein